MGPVYFTLFALAVIGFMIAVLTRFTGAKSLWVKMINYLGVYTILAAGFWLWKTLQIPVDFPQLLYQNFQWWFPLAAILPGLIVLALLEALVAALKKPPAPPAE